MRGERADHSLQATALVNEAYMRLFDVQHVNWQDRAHFMAMTARMMRRILVEFARAKAREKRGGGAVRVSLGEDLLTTDKGHDLVALDDALDALARLDERKSRVVELRFFGGLSVEETAEALSVSPQTVMRDWKFSRAWLMSELERDPPTRSERLALVRHCSMQSVWKGYNPLTMSEYFRRIEAIYHESLRHEGEARSAFLRQACANDDVLRHEVERLLQQSESQHVFLDEQALGVAAQLIDDTEHTELIGRRLGPYEVHARIGAGGMGDVYRARDTTLGRDVAIKILPAALMSNADRRARFEREARVLASLNHPNIGAIYGVEEADGVRAIVLELVEGETLAERLTRGPLPVKQALRIAREIADALDAAHEHGVVHRDLKPANVGLTRDGTVKYSISAWRNSQQVSRINRRTILSICRRALLLTREWGWFSGPPHT